MGAFSQTLVPDSEVLPQAQPDYTNDDGIVQDAPIPPGLTEDEIQAIFRAEVDDAISYSEDTLARKRIEANRYYRGEAFGDEEEGRSQVVSMDVRDVVQSIMPQLMRCFFGTEKVAEFRPEKAGDEEMAEQVTDYVDYIVRRENPGFLEMHSVFKDALISEVGIMKWWAEEKTEVKEDTLYGITPEEVAVLVAEVGAEGGSVEPVSVQGDAVDVKVTRRVSKDKFRIAALPPEEFLRSRLARSIDDAKLVAHRCWLTVSDLVALGYSRDEIVEHAGPSSEMGNTETQERNLLARPTFGGDVDSQDEAMRVVEYVEGYLLIDADGDGVAELRKICSVGPERFILSNTVVSDRPFADFCPDPEPHVFGGLSVTDVTADIQRIKSAIMRHMLDSLAMSVHPRTVAVESQVNMNDVRNTEVGAIIRARQPGMVQTLEMPFIGKEAFPVLDYMDKVIESRVGKTTSSLDPDSLQSATKAAVNASVNAAQEHVELLARMFAETGLKRLYRGLLKLICERQPKERVVKLRGKWVPLNPASWDADMDVDVAVAVGPASIEARKGTLMKIAELQGSIIAQYGPDNPLVSLDKYRYTLAKLIEAEGFRSADPFFNNIQPGTQVGGSAQQGQQSGADQAAMILAQVQAQEIQANMQIKREEMALKAQDQAAKQDLERDRLLADIALRAADIEGKYKIKVDEVALKREMNGNSQENPNAA